MHAHKFLFRGAQIYSKISFLKKACIGASHLNGRFLHGSIACLGETVQFKLADIGEGIKEVTIKEWYVEEGQTVSQFDSICEVQSDKAAVTITSRFDGVIKKLHHAVDDIALVGQALVDIEVEGETGEVAASREGRSEPPPSVRSEPKDLDIKVLATPAVRRLASENNINLSNVRGTGRDGRILKEDIIRFLEEGGTAGKSEPASSATAKAPSVTAAAQPTRQPPAPSTPPVVRDASRVYEDRRLSITAVMKAMTKTMIKANSIPHFGYHDEVEMTSLVKLRNDLKQSGTSISFMPFMIKAASLALTEFPTLNCYADDSCENVIVKGAHNISVAMDTPAGLLVPNIKAVQELSVMQVSQELRRLMELGQAGKLSTGDLSGGTFALSNIGNIGGTHTRPIILPPQVCIGGIGKIQRLPRFVSKDSLEVTEAHILCISWSADHRVVDGATMARFSNKWKSYLEHPGLMLLHLK